MSRFNLSSWTLRYRPLVLYFILLVAVAGAYAYTQLGRSEDPPFTFKVMLIRTLWPGATAQEVQSQVTDRLMRTLQQTPEVDYVGGYSRPGESTLFFNVKDSADGAVVRETWYQVRKRVVDLRAGLPQGVVGPFFDDEFGDVYVELYALEGDGFSPRELRNYADRIRAELLRLPDVAKVDYFGDREERVFVEISNPRLASLGLDPRQLADLLNRQNTVTPSGVVETGTDRIAMRTSGSFQEVEAIRELRFRVDGRSMRLGDIAEVARGYQDPPADTMRFGGRPVLGIGVTMRSGGDVIALGKTLAAAMERIGAALPVGLEVRSIVSMPKAVDRSVKDFLESVAAAIIIVLLVSLASLGFRTGAVVAVAIPIVLAATALLMWVWGIGLNKVSLGSLVLALGLLVDDAIIAVEMMAVKLKQGLDRLSAASFAYTSTAFPMLTGTLVTVAGFLPIATAHSSTGEYTRSIFEVSAIALSCSWIAAVVVVPYLGYYLLPGGRHPKLADAEASTKERSSPSPVAAAAAETSTYDRPFYDRFRRLLGLCIRRRWWVVGITVGMFLAALAALALVPRQFFPDSGRPELLVDLRLPEGASYTATLAEVKKMEALLGGWPQVANYASFVGTGAPRFYLSLDQKLPESNFAQLIVTSTGITEREALIKRLDAALGERFPMVRGRVTRLENGPPVGLPVQFRVLGPDVAEVRRIAGQVAEVMRGDPRTRDTHYDWDEPSKVVRVEVDQEKARLLGIGSEEIAGFLQMSLSGLVATQYREGDRLIAVELRAPADERVDVAHLADLAIFTAAGKSVALSQVTRLVYGLEAGMIWERDRLPTITVRADVLAGTQPITVTESIEQGLDGLRAGLPLGYHIETGGAAESHRAAQQSIYAGVPLMALVVMTLLMLQLKSIRLALMVVATAPLGIIGVTSGLLLSGKPFGFVAMLGTIAMFGIIMRNSVILVDQIEQDICAGAAPRRAVVEAAVRRLRPIVLTAAAAVLALIPLLGSDFFGPMAVALMGGITAATLLTMLFVPALYTLMMGGAEEALVVELQQSTNSEQARGAHHEAELAGGQRRSGGE